MSTVPKRQKLGGRGSHVDLAACAHFLRLVDETEGYEGGGVRIVGFVEVDGVSGDANEGPLGKVGSVGEGERFTDDAGHAYCREKRWRVIICGSRGVKGHTTSGWVETLGLLGEAVHFNHLSDSSICPSFASNDFLDLLAKCLGMLRIFGQVIKSMGEGLQDILLLTISEI